MNRFTFPHLPFLIEIKVKRPRAKYDDKELMLIWFQKMKIISCLNRAFTIIECFWSMFYNYALKWYLIFYEWGFSCNFSMSLNKRCCKSNFTLIIHCIYAGEQNINHTNYIRLINEMYVTLSGKIITSVYLYLSLDPHIFST